MKETLEFNHKKQCGLWLILIGIVLIIAVICGGKFFVNPFYCTHFLLLIPHKAKSHKPTIPP